MIQLTPREQTILKLVVEDFVETATPVSSRSLCKRHNLAYSPATVRNVMMDLEDKGLLAQPHVSAGRIPTDLGYRLYVDSLMPVERLSRSERRRVLENLRKVSRSVEQILQKASQILGEISNQLGIVLLPRFYEGVFDRLELVPITENRTLLIIKIRSGLVKTIMLELDFEISRDTLEQTARILNERLHGLTLGEIKRTIEERLRTVSGGHPSLIQYFKTSADDVFDFEDWEDYYYGGARNILRQPEFSDSSRAEELMSFLENKRSIIQFLGRMPEDRPVRVTIGRENPPKSLKRCSVVTSEYHIGDVHGVIGIIGPTRMDYARMVSIVNYMSRAISEIVTN
jgi:heat-inducible transcriptional repressor